MSKLVDRERTCRLLDIYGNLLTERQCKIISSYYEYDLSISEIAEEEGISRAAVEDALKKSNSKLEEFEKALGLLAKYQKISEIVEEVKQSKDVEKLDNIKEVISHGV